MAAGAKARARAGLTVNFKNGRGGAVSLYWADGPDLALQASVAAGKSVDVNTFPSHKFVAKDAAGAQLGSWTMAPGMKEVEI